MPEEVKVPAPEIVPALEPFEILIAPKLFNVPAVTVKEFCSKLVFIVVVPFIIVVAPESKVSLIISNSFVPLRISVPPLFMSATELFSNTTFSISTVPFAPLIIAVSKFFHDATSFILKV